MPNNNLVNGVLVPCTEKEEAEIERRLRQHIESKKRDYIMNRYALYPSRISLIEILYSSMKAGEIPQCKALLSAIDEIHNKFPAPKE